MPEAMAETLRTTALELAELEAEIERLTARARVLRQIKTGIESYLAINTYSIEYRAVASPRGREAVRAILSEQPGKPMSVPEIASAIAERGWIEPGANVVDATRTSVLRALKTYPDVQRVSHGMYVVTENADGPASTGPSDHLASSQKGGGEHAPVADE